MDRTEAIERVETMKQVYALSQSDASLVEMFNDLADSVAGYLASGQTKVSAQTKEVPQRCMEYLSEHPQLAKLLVETAFEMKRMADSLRDGEPKATLASKSIVQYMRTKPEILQHGNFSNDWTPYISRLLIHLFPDVDWGFELKDVGFVCQWEEGYEEWMASADINPFLWRMRRNKNHESLVEG